MPSLAEVVVALDGNPDRLVGVSDFSDFPAVLKGKKSVGSYQKLNLEIIRSLKPDLIIANQDGNSEDQIQHLKEWSLTVLVVNTSTVDGISKMISQVAEAIDRKKEGQKLTSDFNFSLQELKPSAQNGTSPRVLFEVGDDPLIVVGGKNYINEIIHHIGAINVYSDSNSSYPRVSAEDVLKRDPDQILILAMNTDERLFQKMKDRWERFSKLKAVKTKRIQILHADALLRPGIRLPEGARLLKAAIMGNVSLRAEK